MLVNAGPLDFINRRLLFLSESSSPMDLLLTSCFMGVCFGGCRKYHAILPTPPRAMILVSNRKASHKARVRRTFCSSS